MNSFIALNFIAASGAIAINDTPPTVVSTSPTNGAVNVAIAATVQITFSETMSNTVLNSSTIILRHGLTAVPYSLNKVGAVVTLTPTSNLLHATLYTLEVTAGVMNDQAISIKPTVTVTFTTVA